jgi:hypothetical protein
LDITVGPHVLTGLDRFSNLPFGRLLGASAAISDKPTVLHSNDDIIATMSFHAFGGVQINGTVLKHRSAHARTDLQHKTMHTRAGNVRSAAMPCVWFLRNVS